MRSVKKRRTQRTAQASLQAPVPLPTRARKNQQVKPLPIFDRWMSHPGQGADVRKMAAIYRSAESGWPEQQCELFDDYITRDGHLRSALEGRVTSVAGRGWIITPGGDSPADQRAAEVLEQALRAVPNFNETLVHLLKAVWYGYALSEIKWDVRDGLYVPVWFANVPPTRFAFDEEDYPRLLTKDNLHEGEELEPGHWIYERMPGRIAAASGLMRTCAWLSYFKKLVIRDWIVFSERFGLPYVQGKYDHAASDEDKATLKRAVQELGKDGAAVYSNACELVIEQAQHGGKAEDVQGALARFCDDEISELVSGSTLTSRSGGPGSFALGRVHQDRSFDLTMWDAERIAHRFELDVGTPFIHFNDFAYRNAKAKPPRLKIHVMRDTDPKTRAEVLQILWNMGVPIGEDQIRQEFQLKSGGATLAGPDPAATVGAPPARQ